jgi:hypothetical protein
VDEAVKAAEDATRKPPPAPPTESETDSRRLSP